MLSVARVWQARERIEVEAAALFEGLAQGFEALGEDPTLVDMAREAAADEHDHAIRCRAIVDALHPGLPKLHVPPARRLGPRTLNDRDRLLYESVAMGCVTESLSCGLLLAMRQRAEHALVADTIHHILKDEIQHSRIGWAHLACEARRRDVAWLGAHISPMLRAAVGSDVVPMVDDAASPGLGVLTHEESKAVIRETVETVIAPGLAAHGVAWMGSDALH